MLLAGCSQQPAASTPPRGVELLLEGKSEDEVKLIQRGKSVYSTQCIACHNSNPKEAGALGPAVAGSSLELLQHRVVTGTFPPGYTPKPAPSGGQIHMPPMPHLKDEVPAIHAYLNAIK